MEQRTPSVQQAFGVVFGVAAMYLVGGASLQFSFGEVGLFVAQWALIFVPVVAFVRLGRFDARETLSLRRVGFGQVIGALLLLGGSIPLVWLLTWLQAFVVEVPTEFVEGMEERVRAGSLGRFIWLGVLVGLTPAVCEEFLFRGVLLAAFRRVAPAALVVANGLVFGVFHLSAGTVVRFAPTAALGMVIAWSVWRTRTIWVGVIMHFVNNTVILVLVSGGAAGASDPAAPPPTWLLFVAVVMFSAGARVIVHSSDALHPSPTVERTT